MLPPSIRPQPFSSTADCAGDSSATIFFTSDAEIKFVLTSLVARLGQLPPRTVVPCDGNPCFRHQAAIAGVVSHNETPGNAQPPWVEAVPFYCELRRLLEFSIFTWNQPFANVENR